MEKIKNILKGTHGVFLFPRVLSSNINDSAHVLKHIDIEYIDKGKDRENLRNDMLIFFSDFRKATNEAKKKTSDFAVYE